MTFEYLIRNYAQAMALSYRYREMGNGKMCNKWFCIAVELYERAKGKM